MQPVTLKNWIFRLGAGLAIVVALWALQTYALPHLNDYYQIILINAGIAVILAVSLNLINGITGQFSLGHAGFMAIGAYVSAYFTKEIGAQILDPISFALGFRSARLRRDSRGFWWACLRCDCAAIIWRL
jgi:branched-chain amino acid transport system permease protein